MSEYESLLGLAVAADGQWSFVQNGAANAVCGWSVYGGTCAHTRAYSVRESSQRERGHQVRPRALEPGDDMLGIRLLRRTAPASGTRLVLLHSARGLRRLGEQQIVPPAGKLYMAFSVWDAACMAACWATALELLGVLLILETIM